MSAIHKLPGEHVYDGMHLCSFFPAHLLDRIKNTEFDDADVILASYPKCGQTWTQEIVRLLLKDGDTKLDDRTGFPFLDCELPDGTTGLDAALSSQTPRIVKTHLPATFFHKTIKNSKTKFIVIMRNPKDTLVSYYHFYKINSTLGNFKGTWDEFFELFRNDHLCFGNYFELTLSWWTYRDDAKFLFLKYEEMLKNREETIRQIANFLGKTVTDAFVKTVSEETQFDKMKDVSFVSQSTGEEKSLQVKRKGTVGDWANYFSCNQSAFVDNLCEKYFKEKNLTFDYK